MKKNCFCRILAISLSVAVFVSQPNLIGKAQVTISENSLENQQLGVSDNAIEDSSFTSDEGKDDQAMEQESDTQIVNENEQGDADDDRVKAPEMVASVSVERVTYQTNKVSFQTMEQVIGYELSRYTKADASDREVITDLSQSSQPQLSFLDSQNIQVGKTYFYQVRAYVTDSTLDEETGKLTPVRVYGEYSTAVGILAKLDQVSNVQATCESYKANVVTWNIVAGAESYSVYYATSQNGSYALAGQVNGNLATSFRHTKTADGQALATGKTYYYKVCAAKQVEGKAVLSEESLVCSAKVILLPPQKGKAVSKNYNAVQISFEKVAGANGYEIYRSTKSNKGFKKIATLTKASKVTYVDKKCNTGIKYYYKVRAYRKVGSKKAYSEYSSRFVGIAALLTPKLTAATVITGDTVQLTWKKVQGAQGYQVYRSETKKGTYKKILTINGNVTTGMIGGQENGKTFYYKIRAYRRVAAKNRFSNYSGTKFALFNWFGSANETYSDKARRIFGTDYYQKYVSEADAKAHMTTFNIPVWDFAADKVTKVTKVRSITTNANIAETVKQIFKEIYEGEERFPIKTIGCYSWRGDSSTSEHCCGLAIDINWEENYMIDNGVILSGKYWKPGIDPYSIPLNSEVVTIMEKYGFRRGMWGNRIDYMHFSYFGT